MLQVFTGHAIKIRNMSFISQPATSTCGCGKLFSWRTFIATWLLCATGMAVMAQALIQKSNENLERISTQVDQALFLDPTEKLSFEAARIGTYRPFNGLERIPFNGKIAWLRLTISDPSHVRSPLYLQIRPAIYDEITLFTRSENAAGEWISKTLSTTPTLQKISEGNDFKQTEIYLQLKSRYDGGLLAYVGTEKEIEKNDHRLDIVISIITTLISFLLLISCWKTIVNFNGLSLAISSLLALMVIRLWITLGHAYNVLGISQSTLTDLIVPFTIASILNVGVIFLILAFEIFQDNRFFRWLWIWVFLVFATLVYSIFAPSLATRLCDQLMFFGVLAFISSLVTAAVKSPENLKYFAAKVAFFTLLLVTMVTLVLSLELQGWTPAVAANQAPEVILQTLLLRSSMPLIIVSIASWSFDRLRHARLANIESQLKISNDNLELESKRLERQRNFTAMLAHELKNPLTASHLALSGIEERFAIDDPLQKRAEKIKRSLGEINTIIDRCSEIDGFEQGQMPREISSFSLSQLMSAIHFSNPDERIYMLSRGVQDEALITSDLHYLKIIFNNLLTNALKYSPVDSLVELEVRSLNKGGEPWLELTVSNQVGPAGLPSPDKVFEQFYRSEAARNQSGAGLGLWLAQSLAQALSTKLIYEGGANKVRFSMALKYS